MRPTTTWADLEEPERRALERIRDIARRVAPDADQAQSYGMPALRVAGFTAAYPYLAGSDPHPMRASVIR